MAINDYIGSYTSLFFFKSYPNSGNDLISPEFSDLMNEDIYRENIIKIGHLLESSIENSPEVYKDFSETNNTTHSHFKIDEIKVKGYKNADEVNEDSNNYYNRNLYFS